jgi:DNA mismatch endonuclease (patch repair protein)
MDVHSPETRTYNMSRIKGKNTKPEIAIRKWLWSRGYRYRLHVKGLPGKPDIVLTRLKTIVFVHGCYWHRHPGCKYAYEPKSRVEFWTAKFVNNIDRDKRNQEALIELGWHVVVIWECETKNTICLERLINELELVDEP